MALTYTPAGETGSLLPKFELPTVDGKIFSSKDTEGAKATVIMFICNHCPYVQAIEDRMIKLAQEWREKNVQFVGICSNDPTDYPEDKPEELLKRWRDKNYGFPYLIDESQNVAKAFGAVCTPDIFVYAQNKLFYRGRFDDSWRDPQKVKKQELHEALKAITSGQIAPSPQNPSMGCSIKWKGESA